MSNLLEMKDIVFIDENGEAQAGVDLTIDTRRMTNTKLKELIKQFS